jgi:hypothetical protein
MFGAEKKKLRFRRAFRCGRLRSGVPCWVACWATSVTIQPMPAVKRHSKEATISATTDGEVMVAYAPDPSGSRIGRPASFMIIADGTPKVLKALPEFGLVAIVGFVSAIAVAWAVVRSRFPSWLAPELALRPTDHAMTVHRPSTSCPNAPVVHRLIGTSSNSGRRPHDGTRSCRETGRAVEPARVAIQLAGPQRSAENRGTGAGWGCAESLLG